MFFLNGHFLLQKSDASSAGQAYVTFWQGVGFDDPVMAACHRTSSSLTSIRKNEGILRHFKGGNSLNWYTFRLMLGLAQVMCGILWR